MARTIAIVGESGSGKSTSIGANKEFGIIGLNPKETAIINVMDKDLPFRGSRKDYNSDILLSNGGNYVSTTDGVDIVGILNFISAERQDIKNVIIDDWQYSLADELFAKINKKGYDKFTEIAKHAYDVATIGKSLRKDLNLIFMTHSELDDKKGSFKMKTIGKMLDNTVTIDGLFPIALYTHTKSDITTNKTTFHFLTRKLSDNYGNEIPAKSPPGMFDEELIPNDLGYVLQKADEYYN
jgi:energy-coupling factor transporter ATP-binding protein EcfA2